MAMDAPELHRLEIIERLISHLSMRSYLVKSAIESKRYAAENINDVDAAVALTLLDSSQFQFLASRVLALEERLRREPAPAPDTETPLTTAKPERTNMAKAAPPYFLPQRQNLRKAAEISAIARNAPEVDVTTAGVIEGFLAIGDVEEAEATLTAAQQNGMVAKATDPADPSLTAPPASGSDLAVIIAAIDSLKLVVAKLGMRVGQLESRKPAPTTTGRVVAKAGNSSTKRFRTAEDLHAMIDQHVDHPTTAGAISSLIAAGRLDEAEQHLLAAQRNHEAIKAKNERQAFTR